VAFYFGIKTRLAYKVLKHAENILLPTIDQVDILK